jgi:TctA family transporter
MSDKKAKDNFSLPQRAYAVFISVTGTALLLSSLLSLEVLTDHRPATEKAGEIPNKVYYKLTALCAGLFGTGLLGGWLRNKREDKKADSFQHRIEQKQAAKAALSSAPAGRSV